MVRYTSWNAEYLSTHAEEFARNSTLSVLDYNDKQLEKRYKEDQYGGATPEETLKLFVEALEKKDFELASKYYVPEDQDAALKKINNSDKVALQNFIVAYSAGNIESTKLGSSGSYEVKIVGNDDPTPFIFELRQNPFSKKWKIEER